MVSFSGIGSGLDLGALVDSFVAAERLPIRQIEVRKGEANQKLTTLGSLVSRLKNLESQAEGLDKASEVKAVKSTSSSEGIEVSASDAAAIGTYSFRVDQLATSQSTVSSTYSQNVAGMVGAGSIGISVGGNASVDVVLDGTETLDGIAAKINDSGARASASVIFDGTNYQLMIQSEGVGTAKAMTFQENSITMGLNQPGANLSTAQDAQVTLNGGIVVTRSSNQITDLLAGVTLNLNQVTDVGDPDIQIRVDNDVDALRTKVEAFATTFNEVLGLISVELGSGAVGGTATALAGDSTLQGLQRRLSAAVASGYSHDGGTISMGSVGITLENDGGLNVDSEKFAASLSSNPGALQGLLAGDGTTSFTAIIKSLVTDYTQTGTGIIANKESGLRSRIDAFDDQIQDINDRADRFETRLRRTYTALDSKMSVLNNQLSFLTAAFAPKQ